MPGEYAIVYYNALQGSRSRITFGSKPWWCYSCEVVPALRRAAILLILHSLPPQCNPTKVHLNPELVLDTNYSSRKQVARSCEHRNKAAVLIKLGEFN